MPQVERSCDLAWEVMAFWDCLTLAFVWCCVLCVALCIGTVLLVCERVLYGWCGWYATWKIVEFYR